MAFWNSTGYVTAAPQVEAFAAGVAVAFAAAVAVGPISTSEYTFGTHAVALYNAEAEKTRLWPTLRGNPGQTPPVLSLGFAAPQLDPRAAGAAYFVPAAAPLLQPALGQFASTAGRPQFDPLSAGYYASFQAAAQSGGGIKAFQSPAPPDLALYTAEAEKTQFWQAIQPGQVTTDVLGMEFLFGTHAAALYNAEAGKSQRWPAVVGLTFPTGQLGAFCSVQPQQFDPTVRCLWTSPTFSAQGWIVPFLEAEPQPGADVQPAPSLSRQATATPYMQPPAQRAEPQRVDLTLQPLWVRPAATRAGASVVSFVALPQPYDPTVPAQVWRAVATAQPVAPYVVAAPQRVDLTLPAQQTRAQPAAPQFTHGLGAYTYAPAQRPDQAAGAAWVRASVQLPVGLLGAYTRAAPWLEPWQPAPAYRVPIVGTPPRTGILAPYYSGGPLDLALQVPPTAFFVPAVPAALSIYGWSEVIALTQLGVKGVNTVISALSQAGVEGARSRFLTGSACFVSISYYDINNEPFIPNSVQYRVDDLVSQTNIVPWTTIAPGLSNLVTVTSAQNEMISASRQSEAHQMLFQIVDGSGDQCYARVIWDVVRALGAPVENG